jgi:DNA helicase HerA-like ATPase
VFIDESGELFNAGKRENLWLLTRGRHFGFSVVLIAQRPKMLMPSARSQCSIAYVFRLALEDMKEIGADFGHSGLAKISLDKGDFLILKSGLARFDSANVFKLLSR